MQPYFLQLNYLGKGKKPDVGHNTHQRDKEIAQMFSNCKIMTENF